jgi:hypothetical protein
MQNSNEFNKPGNNFYNYQNQMAGSSSNPNNWAANANTQQFENYQTNYSQENSVLRNDQMLFNANEHDENPFVNALVMKNEPIATNYDAGRYCEPQNYADYSDGVNLLSAAGEFDFEAKMDFQ